MNDLIGKEERDHWAENQERSAKRIRIDETEIWLRMIGLGLVVPTDVLYKV